LAHELKLQLISGHPGERHQVAWTGSILRQQATIEDLLAQSPGLRPRIRELISSAYQNAARVVGWSFRVATPADCPWNQEEILK
jgi:hypothetical protein